MFFHKDNSFVVLSNTVIYQCSAVSGGGIYLQTGNSDVSISSCVIQDCHASSDGGEH